MKCMKCGYTHSDKQCPAMGKKCRFCHKLNHFRKMCLLRKGQKKRHRKGIHSLNDYDSSISDNTDYDSSSSDNTDYDYDRYDYEDIVYVKMISEEKDIHRQSDDRTIKSIIYDNEIHTMNHLIRPQHVLVYKTKDTFQIRHFIRVYTVCFGQKRSSEKETTYTKTC